MTTAMAAIADVAGELGWHAWQASIVGLAALALAAALRRRAPTASALLVSLALLKFVLPPIVRMPLAAGDFAAVITNPFAFVPSGQETEGLARAALAAIALLSLGVTAILGWRVIRQARAIRRIRKRADIATTGPAALAMRQAADRLQLRVTPLLLISGEAEGPFATGVFRPAVVLPRALAAGLDAGSLEIVLAHELVHHRRRDLPMAWCAAAAGAVFWFTPIAGRLADVLRELREECCDADVIRLGFASPDRYAEVLLAAASIPPGSNAVPMSDGHPLARRVRKLLAPSKPIPFAASVFIVALFALLCVPSSPFGSPWGGGGDRIVRIHRIVR